ncbi:MAG TPA: SH3 domain-containing protein, partial [Mobilitalea sp.]|nr:SH3 domain-containing protein [Mobilitalea sp.]
MKSQLLKFSLLCVTGAVIIAANPKTAFASAYEEAVAGFTYDKASASSDNSDNATLTTLASDNIPIPGFSNVGIANVDTNLLIRSGPGSDEKILGKLSKNGGCDILEADKGNGWTKVSSGKVKGYVKTEFLVTGTKASKLALEVGDFIATANTDGIRVRKEPNTNSEILDQIAKGEDLIVLDAKVVSYGEEYNKWVKVRLDSDDSANGQEAYVAKEFVNLSYSLKQ